MELLTVLAGISSCVTGIGAALILLLRPVREALTGTKHLRGGAEMPVAEQYAAYIL